MVHGHLRRDCGHLLEHSGGRILFRTAKTFGRLGRLGAVTEFPLNQTRRINFDNPLAAAVGRHDGAHRRVRALRGQERRTGGSIPACCPSTAPPGLPRVAGFSNRACSCAPVTAAFTTPMASAPPVRRRAACFTASGALQNGRLEIQAPHYPTLQDPLDRKHDLTQKATPMFGWLKKIGNWFDARVRFQRYAVADDAASRCRAPSKARWAGGTSSAVRRSQCF